MAMMNKELEEGKGCAIYFLVAIITIIATALILILN